MIFSPSELIFGTDGSKNLNFRTENTIYDPGPELFSAKNFAILRHTFTDSSEVCNKNFTDRIFLV